MSHTKSTKEPLRRLLALVIAACALTGVSIAAGGAASAAPPTDPKVCQDWASLFREDGSTFKNQGDCAKYAARGGTILTTPPPPPPDPTPNVVTVDPPSAAAGTYVATGAEFGPAPTTAGVSGALVLANDGVDGPTDACSPLIGFPAGAIAIIDRGGCTDVMKVLNAQASGAVAVIIANNLPGAPETLDGSAPSITIPSVMVSLSNGAIIKSGLPAVGTVASG